MAVAQQNNYSGLGIRRGLTGQGLVGIPHVQLRQVQQFIKDHCRGFLTYLPQQDDFPDLGGDVTSHHPQ